MLLLLKIVEVFFIWILADVKFDYDIDFSIASINCI